MSEAQLSKVLELFRAGETARDNGQHRHAAELYDQALKITEAVADGDFLAGYRALFRRAVAHQFAWMERLRESLAVLAPLSKPGAGDTKACCVYGNMSDHIQIAQKLPTSLGTIERAYAQAESYFRSAGESNWRSVLLHLKSELSVARGMQAEALALGQEGWALWADGCPKFYATTHLHNLFNISLALNDERLAQSYLDEWERNDELKSRVRESTFNQMQSGLARLRGQTIAALDYARRAVQSIEIADWGATRFEAGCVMVRACLMAGEPERARDMLRRLLGVMRHSESGLDRYKIQLLRGDYHLAQARRAARTGAFDDELASAFQLEAGQESASLNSQLRKARAAYSTALKTGRWIDEQLECALRQQEISVRLARAGGIEQAASARIKFKRVVN